LHYFFYIVTVEEVQSLEQSGNAFVNTLLEATAFHGEKTSKSRDIFIQEKYKEQKYLSQEKLHQQLGLRQKAARYASLLKKPGRFGYENPLLGCCFIVFIPLETGWIHLNQSNE